MCAECKRLEEKGVDQEKAIREMDEAREALDHKIKMTVMNEYNEALGRRILAKQAASYADDHRDMHHPELKRVGWIGRKIGWWVRGALQGLFNLVRGSYENSVALLDSMNNVLEIERNVAMAVRTMQTELTLLKVQMNTMVRAFDALNNRVQNLEQGQKMLLDAESTGEVYDFSPEGVAKGEMVTRLMKEDGLSQDEAELEADEVIR